jgi:hypothetical protein
MTKKITKPSKLAIVFVSMVCLLVGLISFVIFYFSLPSNARDNQNAARQKEMMILVLEWGRLAPFPASATNISIQTEGSSFTRSFRASFSAPKQDIQTWMKASPGINQATLVELSDNKVKYIIAPSGGANSAEVTIDFTLNKVDIYVSSS